MLIIAPQCQKIGTERVRKRRKATVKKRTNTAPRFKALDPLTVHKVDSSWHPRGTEMLCLHLLKNRNFLNKRESDNFLGINFINRGFSVF